MWTTFFLGIAIIIIIVPINPMFDLIVANETGAWFLAARRAHYLALCLIIPILLHGAYDWPLMVLDAETAALFFVTLAVIGVEWTTAVRLLRRFRAQQIEYFRPHA